MTTCLSNKISVGQPPITLSDVNKIVSEEDILAYYFHIYRLPTLISSPLRKDVNPSFSIYFAKNGRIRCYDFGLQKSYGLYDLLMEYFHIGFSELLHKIWHDMCHITTRMETSVVSHKQQKPHTKLEVCTRNFRDYDLQFWNSFGINIEWLRFGRVFAISDIVINKNNTISQISADKYAYVYVEFKDNIQSLKIYQPYNTKFKWMSDGNDSIWNLWTQLPPTGDKLIITSSLKDALCLWANIGIPSCCLQSEIATPKKHIIEQLKTRFKKVFILYDNDFQKEINVGQKRAVKIAEEYNLHNICIDSEYGVKDPSDFYKKYGKQKFRKTFLHLTI